MRKTLIIVLATILLLTIANTAGLVYCYRQTKNTVVIDVIKVFNEFKMKKDLESRVAVKLNDYSASIDSMQAVFTNMKQANADPEKIRQTGELVDTLRSRAQRAYVTSDKAINEQVWMRLNALLTEYGDQYGYTLVIGANGMGTVLYNQKEIDKTEELIRFINKKYELGH